jgi:hypothetical protein
LTGIEPITRTLLQGARPLGTLVALCTFLIFLISLVNLEIFAGQMRGRCFHEDGSLARYGEPADATVLSGLQNPNGKPILCNSGQTGGFGSLFMSQQACPETQTCSIYTNPTCVLVDALNSSGGLGAASLSPSMAHSADDDDTEGVALGAGAICEYNENPDRTFNMDGLGRAMLTLIRTWMLDEWWRTMRYLQVCPRRFPETPSVHAMFVQKNGQSVRCFCNT